MLSEAVVVALIGLGGSCVGSLFGIICSSKLNNYRWEQLEKKVDRHNNLVDRMYTVEQNQAVLSTKISVVNHRLDELESHSRRDALC